MFSELLKIAIGSTVKIAEEIGIFEKEIPECQKDGERHYFN